MKIQLSPQKKMIPFTLQVIDSKGAEIDVDLFVTRFSIADATRRDEMLSPYYEKKDTMSPLTMVSYIAVARVLCSIKDSDGNYFFEYDLETAVKELDDDFVSQISEFVNELNPFGTKKKITSQKHSKTKSENS